MINIQSCTRFLSFKKLEEKASRTGKTDVFYSLRWPRFPNKCVSNNGIGRFPGCREKSGEHVSVSGAFMKLSVMYLIVLMEIK